MALAAAFTLSAATAAPATAQEEEPGQAVLTTAVVTSEYDTRARNTRIRISFPNGNYAGFAEWSRDPGGDTNGDGREDPGDAVIVYDAVADGWGIEATLLTDGRVATTRGHNSPYWSPWASGNLAEDTAHRLRVCIVRGDSSYCALPQTVWA